MTFEQLLKHFWILEYCSRESVDTLDDECPTVSPPNDELQNSKIE